LLSVYSASNGEVQIYEVSIPHEWEGRTVGDLVPAENALPVAIARGGRACLPARDTVLHAQDILQVSATDEGAAVLRQRLQSNGEK